MRIRRCQRLFLTQSRQAFDSTIRDKRRITEEAKRQVHGQRSEGQKSRSIEIGRNDVINEDIRQIKERPYVLGMVLTEKRSKAIFSYKYCSWKLGCDVLTYFG